ncbi:MAG: hypothetical protein Q8O45_09185 [Desulfurivibrionaceae bacterium]|nr:hypothetical protein [Desulfurivibrionaceae bacterium]
MNLKIVVPLLCAVIAAVATIIAAWISHTPPDKIIGGVEQQSSVNVLQPQTPPDPKYVLPKREIVPPPTKKETHINQTHFGNGDINASVH